MIQHICSDMENWTLALGPVEDWPCIFHEQYDKVYINTTSMMQVAINTFLVQVEEHVKIRKHIIAGLESCTAVKLHQPQGAEADRLLTRDLMRTLCRGVAVLKARLEILDPLQHLYI